MTPGERAEDLVRRFDEPVMDKTNYRVQAMINMTEEAIAAAVEEEREEVEDRYANERDTYLETIERLENALRMFEDGANWEVYPGLRQPAEYIWRHDSDPRVLAQDACNKSEEG